MKKINVGGELLKKAPNSNLLYHQYRTVEALNNHSVVFNTYPTGSGKTKAALERLKENSSENVLFIAPTNELLVQHEEDIKEFVIENNLNYKVIRIDANVITKIKESENYEGSKRRGSLLHEILRNPLEYEEFFQLDYLDNITGKVILVVNPDIFYYTLYGLYGNLDKGNLMDIIITNYNYIVIDEFHYYNSKQLVNFLFFIVLSKHLGYFHGKRKICILTATPDKLIQNYLRKGEIDYKIISPENEPEESENFETINTLSKMELFITNNPIEEVILEYLDKSPSKDSVVISESMIKINKMKASLENSSFTKEDIGVITGAIYSKERKKAIAKNIILATPTVDIGYNFKKQGKERQNIDEVITEARSSDQALQRIGRAGRILGKKIQNEVSKVILCVNNDAYYKFSEVIDKLNDEEITRKQLKNIILHCLSERKIMKKYIETGAILELSFPLDELFNKYSSNDKYEKLEPIFNNLVEVFCNKKSYSFKKFINEVKDYKKACSVIKEYNLNDNDSYKNSIITNEFNKKLINENLISEALNELGNFEEPISVEFLQQFNDNELNETKINCKDLIIEYLQRKNCITKALINFRGSAMSLPTLVYDKFNIFTQEEKVFKYDIFHLLKYYDITWYKNINEFNNAIGYKCNEALNRGVMAYVKVNGIKEKPCEIALELIYDGNQREFEKKYFGGVKALKCIILTMLEKTGLGKEITYIPEEIKLAFKDEYIPILFKPSGKEGNQINNIIKDQFIFIQNLKVTFSNGSNHTYEVLTGSSALMVNYEIIRLKDPTELTESFII